MKLHEINKHSLGLRLPDLAHIAKRGRLAFRMGIDVTSNPHPQGRGYSDWKNGWMSEQRDWTLFLKRNGGKLW
jgi:hypothetical protein